MTMCEGGDTVRHRKQDRGHVETSREDIKPTSKSAGWTLFGQLLLTLLSLPFVYVIYVWLVVDDVIDPKVISINPPPILEGNLALNNILVKAEKLFEGEIQGPESIAFDKGHLYAGTADGKVVHIEKGKLEILVDTFGKKPCGGIENEKHCGRPLGMRFDSNGYLIVLDAYLGLFKVNVATGDFVTYFSSETVINGAKPKFLNDLDIAEDGSIYFTDTSTQWNRNEFVFSFLEGDNTGRLLKYNPKNNTIDVLVDGLQFPNGVQISRNQDYILFTETMQARIWKYHLKGPKPGHVEIFLNNLPGLPDNIRKCRTGGGYWVPLPICRNKESFSLWDFTTSKLWLRSFIAKAFSSATLLSVSTIRCGRVIQVNEDGQIVKTLHDASGTNLYSISEVADHEGTLYFGSFKAPFIGKLDAKHLQSLQ